MAARHSPHGTRQQATGNRQQAITSPVKDTTVRGTAVGFIASAAVHLTQLATTQQGDRPQGRWRGKVRFSARVSGLYLPAANCIRTECRAADTHKGHRSPPLRRKTQPGACRGGLGSTHKGHKRPPYGGTALGPRAHTVRHYGGTASEGRGVEDAAPYGRYGVGTEKFSILTSQFSISPFHVPCSL